MIRINCEKKEKALKNFWNNIHFHPTDAIEDDWGRAILDEVAHDNVAKCVRMYTMLEDIVSIDENKNLHYDFTENDTRMDYMVSKGFDILLCYNFLPPCIAENTGFFQNASKKSTRYKGKLICTSRLADDSLWEEICYQYTKHIVERYGLETVEKWHLQCYNEPDITTFFMTELGSLPENLDKRVEEYMRLYRGLVHGAARVSPTLKVGGPATAGHMDFCEKLLETIKSEGLKFDFFSGHSYGTSPTCLNDGSVPFDTQCIIQKIRKYQDLLDLYFPDTEIIIDEWGASAHGFYDIEECPRFIFREGSEYAAYFGNLIEEAINSGLRISKLMICLSGQHDLPCDFSGCRNFMGKNMIKKPIYNAYALASKLGSFRTKAKTDIEGLTVLSTEDNGRYTIMLAYASKNFDALLPNVNDTVLISGINGKKRVRVWCIDEEHTNPYKYKQRMNWGDHFTEEQIEKLREVGTMKPISEYDETFCCEARIPISFTSNALVLIEILPIS